MPEETHAAEFLEALTAAKEKIKEKEKKKKKAKKEKPAKEKRVEKEKKKEKKEKVRKKLAEISVEKEAAKIPAKQAKPLPPAVVPPIYRRPLPPLPPAPKIREEWPPIRPPKAPARPPEEEAAAPPVAEAPTPAAPEVRPTRPILDIGKLNPLITDPTITTIQCDGANIPIKLIRAGRIEEIPTMLSEEEIKSTIKAFSDASGQTITEPMFKTNAAGWTISATISAFAGSKFVITRG